MRRTAARIRNAERKDDESLVRHIYDHFKITEASGMDIDPLIELAQATIAKDAERYGNQHPQLRGAPIAELKLGLEEIGNNPIYEKRYVVPPDRHRGLSPTVIVGAGPCARPRKPTL